MKAILILNDMPTSCEECPCEYDDLYCQRTFHPLSYDELFDHRPNDCPLKEMPKPMKWNEQDEYPFPDPDQIYGWNECLKAIGGDDNAD